MILIELKNQHRTLDLIVPEKKDMDVLISYLLCQIKNNERKQIIKLLKDIIKFERSEILASSVQVKNKKIKEPKELETNLMYLTHEDLIRYCNRVLKYNRIARI
jgi:hypothetical protein